VHAAYRGTGSVTWSWWAPSVFASKDLTIACFLRCGSDCSLAKLFIALLTFVGPVASGRDADDQGVALAAAAAECRDTDPAAAAFQFQR
jgi:hypothetical protein